MTKYSVEQELGCGVMGGIFQRWSNWSRKSSLLSLPAKAKNEFLKRPVITDLKSNNPPTTIDSRQSDHLAKPLPKQDKKPARKSDVLPPRKSISNSNNQRKDVISRRPSDAARSSTSSSSGSKETGDLHPPNNSMPKPPRKNSVGKLGTVSVMGNIIRQPSEEFKHFHGSPEALKNKGNEAYKQGKFVEALSLYEQAISLDSKQATYRCNKSAALLGLGRLLEAVTVCKEAIQLDPTYQRAHHRLATIYLRLGEAEQALYHYKQAGNHADSSEINDAQALNKRLIRCSDARKWNEWSALLKETKCAIASGVDSAPKVYALQTEALLKLHIHQEAYATYRKGPNFAIESCINFFGLHVTGYLLMIRALVYMASGRLDEALSAAEHAARLDPGNKEISLVVKRIRAVSSARSSGNLLFKESKFLEACSVYGEGLEHDPYNSVLLCNRAACRSKLGQFERAVEDCTAAINVQPSYSKARLRRADCNAKLERWEAAIQDYEMLIRETPGDEKVAQALFEAQVQLRKQHDEDVKVEVEDHPYIANSEAVKYIPTFKIYRNGSGNNPELLERSFKLYSS